MLGGGLWAGSELGPGTSVAVEAAWILPALHLVEGPAGRCSSSWSPEKSPHFMGSFPPVCRNNCDGPGSLGSLPSERWGEAGEAAFLRAPGTSSFQIHREEGLLFRGFCFIFICDERGMSFQGGLMAVCPSFSDLRLKFLTALTFVVLVIR